MEDVHILRVSIMRRDAHREPMERTMPTRIALRRSTRLMSQNRVVLCLLCVAPLLSARLGAEPPPKTVADEARLPARVEKLLVRDTVQADGSTSRTIEAEVLLNDAVGVSQFGQ